MLLHKNMRKNRMLISLLLLFAVSAAAEVFVFNFRFFIPAASHAKHVVYEPGRFSDTSGTKSGKMLIIDSDGSFQIDGIGVPIYNVKINVAGSISAFTASVGCEDDNFSAGFRNAGDYTIDTDVNGSTTVSVESSGKCRALRFAFSGLNGQSIGITSVEINKPYFEFKVPRFLLFFLLLALLCLIRRYKPWKIPYRGDSEAQWRVYSAIALVSVLLMGFIFVVSAQDTWFQPDLSNTNDNYLLLTQAFSHGRLDLMIQPPHALKELANPYDYSLRTAKNVAYSWDTIYYHGKYYSYFGTAPVILLLLPFKLLTGNYLPTSLGCFLFAMLCVFGILRSYRTAVELWFPKINLLMFACGEAALILASNLFWLVARPDFYELACLSANAFLFLGIDTMLLTIKNNRRTGGKLFLSGLFFALMVASRPNFFLYLLIAVPFLVPLLKNTERISRRSVRLIQFSAPLAVIGSAMMAYNFLRFGSVFDFGIKYQLTVSDLHFNKITDISKLIPGLYHYFIHPLRIDLYFPFFHVDTTVPAYMSKYYFDFPSAGLFNFPLLLILPACVFIIRRIPAGKNEKKRFLATSLICSAVLILTDILYAGVTMRYLLDVQLLLTLVSVLLWMETFLYFDERKAGAPVSKLFAAVTACAVLVSLAICVTGENGNIVTDTPRLYYYLSQMFEFWR